MYKRMIEVINVYTQTELNEWRMFLEHMSKRDMHHLMHRLHKCSMLTFCNEVVKK